MSIEIAAQSTPNPETLKFIANLIILEAGTADFTDKASAEGSPLAEALFALENVEAVFVGTNFVTVTKSAGTSWDTLAEPLINTLREALAKGGKFVETTAQSSSQGNEAGSDIEQKIKEILDREIRPAVAMDGGDITFHSYADGIVTLNLRGACSSCPASSMTLKMGVEARLKEVIPEIKEVVQI